eukprot:TRINITY_DN58048_c0_g1_i1.p1 TRINITY_DN58048_c0_g1~~TRINITY_DN58048_c0_g1_i1.p1  ORF type:complete len:408 (+),score=49.99 TRINITY_DN58048_c0_g1_i1:159-1382(+)
MGGPNVDAVRYPSLPRACWSTNRGNLLLNAEEHEALSHIFSAVPRGKVPYSTVLLAPAEDDLNTLQPRLLQASRSRSRSRASKCAQQRSQQQRPEAKVSSQPRSSGQCSTQSSYLDSCQVIEVETQEERKAAYNLHLSKNTFHEERQLVEFRIFRGDVCKCRTWVLVPDKSRKTTADSEEVDNSGGRGVCKGRGRGRATGRGKAPTRHSERQVHCLAAVTLKMNRYISRQGRWAQILNMSTSRERQGYGTVLIAGLEELLRREETDVVVLYPAENGRAPAFWSSLGYGARSESHLPDEELVPHDKGGPLLPEFDPGSKTALPRWEKRLLSGVDDGCSVIDTDSDCDISKPKGRNHPRIPQKSKEFDYRMFPASASRLAGDELREIASQLREQRVQLKAAFKRQITEA